MELRICVETQQGLGYDDIIRAARAAELAGFGGFFVSDHYLKMPWKHAATPGGLPGPTDAWTTLAGLARDTTTVRLGTLLGAATFRQPVPLAIIAAQVDQMSGGRVVFGLGAGWFEEEHRVHGLPFPGTAERFDRLEEQLAVITGLWRSPVGSSFSFVGRHYQIIDSPALPKPEQAGGPPVIVGGSGPKRTPALAARFATEYNAPFFAPGNSKEKFAIAAAACEAIGRDPASLICSGSAIVCCGADEAEARRRAEAIRLDPGADAEGIVVGTPSVVIDALGAFAEAGASIAYLEINDLTDLDHLALIGEVVLPALA